MFNRINYLAGFFGCLAVLTLGCSDDGGGSTGGGPLVVETRVVPQIALVGQSFYVTCSVTDAAGQPADRPTKFTVTPSLVANGNSVQAGQPGLHEVACSLTDDSAKDLSPSLVYVIGPNETDRVVVDTFLSQTSTPIGTPVTVGCQVSVDGIQLINPATVVKVSPDAGITLNGNTITGSQSGAYSVACAVEGSNFSDTTPETLLVGSSETLPAKVITSLDPSTAATGESVTVTCTATSGDGSVVNAATVVDAPVGVVVVDHSVSSSMTGLFPITCRLIAGDVGVEHVSANLTVVAGAPANITAAAAPDKAVYAPGDSVTITATAADAYGNAVEDVAYSVTGPQSGVKDLGNNKYELLSDGAYTFTASLDANPTVKDTIELIVDGEGPVLVITEPARGQTFDGNQNIIVKGTVSDDFGGVVSLSVNGKAVTWDPGTGTWSTVVQVVHGMNVVTALATDAHTNVTKATVTWYYSTKYIGMDFAKPDASYLNGALKVWLSQQLIDDKDHTEADVDDLAHLLEILLANVDFTDLVEPPSVFEYKDPGLVDVKNVGGSALDLTGDLVVTGDITKITFGTAKLNLTSRDGGIDLDAKFDKQGAEPGLTIHLTLTLKFDVKAEGTYPSPIGNIPVSVTLNPQPSVQATTTLTIDTLDLSTSFDIGMNAQGEVEVVGQKLNVKPDGIYLAPIAGGQVDLGSVQVSVFGLPLPINVPLGKIDLTALVGNLGQLIADLTNPVLDAVVPLATNVLEPLIKELGGEAIEKALKTLEIDQTLPVPEMVAGQPAGSLQIKAKITSVDFSAKGGIVELDALAASEKVVEYNPLGSILRDGCLGVNNQVYTLPTTGAMEFGISLDIMNEALFSAWNNGVLNLDVSLGALTDNEGLKGGKMKLTPLLPPIMDDCNNKGTLKVQLGDAYLVLTLPLGSLEIEIVAWLSAELDIGLVVENDMLNVVINGVSQVSTQVVSASGPLAGLESTLDDLIANVLMDQLIGNLVGNSLSGFPLPEFDLSGLAPTIPQGTKIGLKNLKVTKKHGYLQVEGSL